MAKTLNQLRFELLEIVNQYTDDSKLDYRLMDEFIINKRVKWFENTYNKFNKDIPTIYYQTLSCVPVTLVDQAECCSVDTGCLILRTVDKLPAFLSLTDGELIDKVSPVGVINLPFNIIPYRRAEFFGSGRYNKLAVGVFLLNGYLYFISRDTVYYPLIEKITVRGVFRDPREAERFISCEDKPCWNPDMAFPIEERLWDYCKQDILATDLKVKFTNPLDVSNDNLDNRVDPQPQSGNIQS